MIFAIDHAAGECCLDQRFELLCWPIRLRKRVLIFCKIDLLAVDTFVTPAGCLCPMLLRLQAR